MKNDQLLLYIVGGLVLMFIGGAITIRDSAPDNDMHLVPIFALAALGGMFFGMGLTNLAVLNLLNKTQK